MGRSNNEQQHSDGKPPYRTDTERAGIPTKTWCYLALAFGVSWGAYALRSWVAWGPSIDQGLRLTVKFGPSLAGILVAAVYGGFRGVAELVWRLRIPVRHPGWIALAFGLPIAILIVALALRALFGAIVPLHVMPLREAAAIFGSLLATRFFLGGGLGEEIGWRGVMLPDLQSRMGALRASMIIGLVHGAWHVPAYGAGALFLTLFTVSGSVIFTWMYNNTRGNLFLPALMHATANASLPFVEQIVPAIDDELGYPLLVFLIWAVVASVIVSRGGLKDPSV